MKLQTESEHLMMGGDVFRVDSGKGKPIYPEIVHQAYTQIKAMLSHHERVLLVRVDVRNYDSEVCNRIMSRLFNKLKKRLNTKAYGFINRLGYVWAREQKTSEAPHYHLALMLDGHKVRHPHRVVELVEDVCWRSNLPKPHTPKNCYYLLKRSEADGQTLADAVYRLSYLAKVNTKDKRPSTTHDYGTSRIKPRLDRKNSPVNTTDQNTEVTP